MLNLTLSAIKIPGVYLAIVVINLLFVSVSFGQKIENDTIYILIDKNNEMVRFHSYKSHPYILEKDSLAKDYTYVILTRTDRYTDFFHFAHNKYPIAYLKSVERMELEVHIYERDSSFLKAIDPLTYQWFVDTPGADIEQVLLGADGNQPKIFIIDKADIEDGKIKLIQVVFYPETRE